MARCFPNPLPERYLGTGGGGGRALLGGPIKPHAETEKHTKKDTEKWLKRKSSGSDKVEETKPKRIKFTTKSGGSGGSQKKGSKEEDTESSGVTEEHGPPVCSQSPCHSSESVRVINQRATTNDNSLERKRNVFRIKLNVPKPEEPVISVQADQPSTSSASQPKNIDVSERNPDILPSTSVPWKNEKDVSSKVGKTRVHVSHKSKSKEMSIHDLYQSLTDGWTPPELQAGHSEPEEELDWLCASRKPAGRSSTIDAHLKSASSCSAASSSIASWPRAQFLPEVEVYALPYTVPF